MINIFRILIVLPMIFLASCSICFDSDYVYSPVKTIFAQTAEAAGKQSLKDNSKTSKNIALRAKSNQEKSSHEGPIAMSIYWILPFIGILLSIALIPLINGEWWHHNFQKVSLFWGLPVALIMFFLLREKTIRTVIEYCSFLALVGSLFVVSGGILIRGSFKSGTITNCIFLFIGSILASFIGTAGASMVLIRPLLRINAQRKTQMHIFIFFIFIVSNIGGSLTPLGDPPLFLGFLQGVPFGWTLIHMLPGWGISVLILLAIFSIIDAYILKRDGSPPDPDRTEKFQILGTINFIFLLAILGTVVLYGNLLSPKLGYLRDAIQIFLMLLITILSMKSTPRKIREENGFTFFAIKEVAVIFAAIFACMIPALNILEYMGSTGKLSVSEPWKFFWLTGILSSFLDNAPTYLTFLSIGKTMIPVDPSGTCVLGHGILEGIQVYGGCIPRQVLLAISMGAVFMGANSYIGNAPNFMVKSICEENNIKMPSFFGYMAWSVLILIPIFILITFIFFI